MIKYNPMLTRKSNLFLLSGLLWSLGFFMKINAQSSLPVLFDATRNYIITNTILADSITIDLQISRLNAVELQRQVNYFDGLGRQVQSVNVQASPAFKDIIQPVDYDEFGRSPIDYLPYVSGTNNGSFQSNALDPVIYTNSDQYNFYQTAQKIEHDVAPYASKKFEPSPLNRVLEQGAPGNAWQPDAVNESGKTIKFRYRSNAGSTVRLWTLAANLPQTSGFYAANELTLLVTVDEHGNETREYTDKLGRVVLKEIQHSVTDFLQTYYVYDDFNNLRFVFPPEASKQLGATYTPASLDDPLLKDLAFQYRYDERQRMIEKKVPGADVVYIAYDQWDRLVLTQDGNQRPGNRWSFTKYDLLNRPVITGTYIDSRIADSIRNDVKSRIGRFETSASDDIGYTIDNTFPTNTDGNTRELLTITYYDRYDFVNNTNWDAEANDFTFISELGYTNTDYLTIVRGQVTGAKTKVLGQNTWLNSITYYDDRYRVIQILSENYVGGKDVVTSEYFFPGWVKRSKQTHKSGIAYGSEQLVINRRYEYDHTGRLMKVFHQVEGQNEVIMAANDYNELGELVEKNLHANDIANPTYKQSTDYRYNIRGWLKQINNSDLAPTGINITDPKPDYFGMELIYEQGLE